MSKIQERNYLSVLRNKVRKIKESINQPTLDIRRDFEYLDGKTRDELLQLYNKYYKLQPTNDRLQKKQVILDSISPAFKNEDLFKAYQTAYNINEEIINTKFASGTNKDYTENPYEYSMNDDMALPEAEGLETSVVPFEQRDMDIKTALERIGSALRNKRARDKLEYEKRQKRIKELYYGNLTNIVPSYTLSSIMNRTESPINIAYNQRQQELKRAEERAKRSIKAYSSLVPSTSLQTGRFL